MNDSEEETTADGGRRRFTAGAVLGLLFLAACLAAVFFARNGSAGSAMNAAAGAALALGLLAGTEIAAVIASRRGDGAAMPVSVLGSLARMAAVAGTLVWAGTRAWFEPIPFVAAFGVLYFAVGLGLVLRQGAGRLMHRSAR